MQLGISSFTYGWAVDATEVPMTEVDLLYQTRAFGLTCLQIGDNLPLHTFSEERLQDFYQGTVNQIIRLEIGAKGLRPAHLQRYIQLAGQLQAPLLRFIIDGADYEPKSDEVIAMIRDVLPELASRNLTLGIENHDRFKAVELAAILEAVGSERVGICLDCANSIGANEGLAWVTQVLAPFTVNFHVKDFAIERLSHKMGFLVTGRPAGQGMLDLPWMLEQLSYYNRCQSAILELWTVPESDPLATIEKEASWAEESVAYLKSYFEAK
ncbi:MAG: sugar phosphate isomerase/epimerase [Cytophagaceae bacterium]|nr:sugar phosphate isomerase/epimerase [Cytophagaceae bacterium]